MLIFTSCVYDDTIDEGQINGKNINLLLDEKQANRLASLPLKCLDQEYPNKLGQVLGSEKDLKSPKSLHPAFYGCFDWHSAVHGHWMLVRLAKVFPNMEQASTKVALANHLSKENIAVEMAFFDDEHNGTFERTYGWAWLFKLHEELLLHTDPFYKELGNNLTPLANKLVDKFITFLPKLNHPLRSGEHVNTAFALTFAYDYAVATNNQKFLKLIVKRSKDYYLKDERADMAYEPSGFDFLSPILEEVHLMSKILDNKEFSIWLTDFMPKLMKPTYSLEPAVVTDRKDGKLVHLDGLNLSRAWCLYAISRKGKSLRHLRKIADEHLRKSLPMVVDGNYSGEHWLASFALYALLERKI